MNQPAGAAVTVDAASKSFGPINALRDVSLKVDPGEAVAIAGRSGSGKSTLLSLIGGLEQPDEGRVLIDGRPIWRESHPAHVRRDVVGFIFQRHLLRPPAGAARGCRRHADLPTPSS
jgi:putative ABC transport system ATP-binding protein